MNFRIRVMMERLRSNDADAVRHALERFDAAHARTLRASFNVEQEDALLYHIVLNTDRLPVDACVNAVCQLAEHPRFRDRATTRTELADKLLEAKINSALTEEIGIATAPTGVTVSAVNGRITLAGTSSSGALRRRAEKIAHRVAGVCQIDNRIVSVPTRGGGFYTDASRWTPRVDSEAESGSRTKQRLHIAHAAPIWPAPYGSANWGTPAAQTRADQVVDMAESDPGCVKTLRGKSAP
jgi:hypothetical protein